jgi:hypothetical protein
MGTTEIHAPHVTVFGTGGKESRAWPCVARDAGRGLIAEFSKPGHGSIWVQRARALHYALAENDHRVAIQIDGDLEFSQAMIPELTRACEETRGIVGTLVAKSAHGAGLATKPPVGDYSLGERRLVRTYEGIGSPMAIHCDAYQTLLLGRSDPKESMGPYPPIRGDRWYEIADVVGNYCTLFHPCLVFDHGDVPACKWYTMASMGSRSRMRLPKWPPLKKPAPKHRLSQQYGGECSTGTDYCRHFYTRPLSLTHSLCAECLDRAKCEGHEPGTGTDYRRKGKAAEWEWG